MLSSVPTTRADAMLRPFRHGHEPMRIVRSSSKTRRTRPGSRPIESSGPIGRPLRSVRPARSDPSAESDWPHQRRAHGLGGHRAR
jgi:hypothetical protein